MAIIKSKPGMNGQLGIKDQKRVDAILDKPQSTWTPEECKLIAMLQEQQGDGMRLKSCIETWDDPMTLQKVYQVKLPMFWLVRQKDRIGLTWIIMKLIWGIGAQPKPEREGV